MSTDDFNKGDRVRVSSECPHTLPAYARMLTGEVLGPSDGGLVTVSFGEGRVFPVEAEYLIRVEDPEG